MTLPISLPFYYLMLLTLLFAHSMGKVSITWNKELEEIQI